MKRKGLLLILLTLVCLFFVGANVANAEDGKITFSTLYNGTTNVDGLALDGGDFKVVFAKASASTAPSYYVSGGAVRLYAKGTMTVSSDYTITKIVLTYGSSDKTNTITTNCGTFSTNTWTGSAKSVVFTVGGTKDHRRIASVTVTYTKETVNLTKLQTPVISCVDDQTGTYTWNTVSGAAGYSYTIGDEAKESTTPIEVTLKDGQTLTVFAKGDNKTTADSDSIAATYDAPANIKVKNLVSNYYFEGSYVRETEIFLNDEAQDELISCFHAKVNMLQRTTYFKPSELWMTNEAGTYSYYGTKGNDLTGGRVDELGQTVDSVALKNVGGMEEYYTTLTDIKDSVASAEWELKEDGSYVSKDATMIKLFLDFTAPCFYGLENSEFAYYFSLSGVSVKDNKGVLELRLLTTGDDGKITSPDKALSLAKISKYTEKVNGNLESAVKITFNSTANRTTFTSSQQIWEENGLVITNNQAGSTNAVADYSNPARFYKDSVLIIESANGAFNQITFKISESKYVAALSSSLSSLDGVTVTTNETEVVVVFEEAIYSVEFVLSGGQTRFNYLICEYVA